MSFWNKENYNIRLSDFVERFVPHNTCVKLFKHILHKNEEKWCHEYVFLWRGMDWQITEGYSCSDYFKYHPDVEPCPFSENNVVSITSVGLSGEFADEVSLVVEELQE
jgi:hypothetical protein